MKTIKDAIKEFNREHSSNFAVFDDIESYRGYYRIGICDDWGWCHWYTFSTVKDFVEWSKGVVFENEL